MRLKYEERIKPFKLCQAEILSAISVLKNVKYTLQVNEKNLAQEDFGSKIVEEQAKPLIQNNF